MTDAYYVYGGTARDNETRPSLTYCYGLSYFTQHDLDRREKGITSPDSVFFFRRTEDRQSYREIFEKLGAMGFKEWTVT